MSKRQALTIPILFLAIALPQPAYSEAGRGCLSQVIDFTVAAAKEASGLLTSSTKLLLHDVSGGRFYSDIAVRSAKKVFKFPAAYLPEEVGPALREIDTALRGSGFPLLKLQNEGRFQQWSTASKAITDFAKVPEDSLSPYVIFRENGQTAFVKAADSLVPVEIDSQGAGMKLLADQKIKLNPAQFELNEESLVRKYARENHAGEPTRLRAMSEVTNDMRYPRDEMFEWEGALIARDRQNGGRSVPNIQELMRAAGRRGISVSKSGEITFIPEIEAPLERAYKLAFPNDTKSFPLEYKNFRERQVYHSLTQQFFEKNPALVDQFLASPEYAELGPEFFDKHAAYMGATQHDLASGMLAEMKLYQYERNFQGATTPSLAKSQRYLADVPGYHAKLEAWLEKQGTQVPRDVPSLAKSLGTTFPFSTELKYPDDLKTMVKNANTALDTVSGQIARHPVHNEFTKLAGKMGLITDTRRSFPNNVIANVGLAKSEAEGAYTISAYFNPARADGYFGPSLSKIKELPRFELHPGTVSKDEAGRMLLEIAKAKSFTEQSEKVGEYAPKIAKYLVSGEGVPPSVKDFAKVLYSDDFAATVYKKMGSVYDPNSINRFFPDSVKEFQKMNMYRYVFDLAHGETSVLVKNHSSRRNYLERVFMGKWKKYNFEKVSETDATKALDQVLSAGDSRLKRLNHQPVSTPMTPVDIRDKFEVAIGWDTYDMKFLRWADHWDQWDAMGGGWNCVCFTRKSVFNPFSIRQF